LYIKIEYSSSGEPFITLSCVQRRRKIVYQILKQIIVGIKHFHKLNVVHRDLQPENLIFDHSKRIKIVDFGLSNM